MAQLLLHLLGDYVTQTDWMANNKTQKKWIAVLHAFIYTLPFVLLTQSIVALFVIFATHAVIDHYRLATYLIYAKNWVTNRKLKWKDCLATGYAKTTPIWLATTLLIVMDNFLHLAINFLAIRYL